MESPLAPYYLILGSSVALVVLGLIMVLSSSSVTALTSQGSSYAVFSKQAMFAALGLPLCWVAAAVPVRFWKAVAWPLLLLTLVALAAVPLIGTSKNGNQNWIVIGGLTLQPSEAAKLALVVWSAAVLARKQPLLDRVPHLLVPVLPGACLVLVLVMLGRDLGTALILMALVAALLYTAGAPMRLFAAVGLVATAAVALLVVTSPNRMTRMNAWLGMNGPGIDYLGADYQSSHSVFALASGGWWGLGLGASREKWLLLPEAHNDFIFAVIGEELGLAGTLAVLGLFAVLGVGLCKLVLAADDFFVKIATGGVLAWVLGQAIVNIGAVIGLLPVIGVPLPLVSSGGSALVTTLVALGMVLGFARRVPGAAHALSSRPRVVRRSFAVVPGRVAAGRPRQLRPARTAGTARPARPARSGRPARPARSGRPGGGVA
jgi:cell division protein FtsW